MSPFGMRLRARAFTVVAATVTVFATLTLPAAPAAEAAGLPDLTIPNGTRTVTVKVNTGFSLVQNANNIGSGSASSGIHWQMTLPQGFRFTGLAAYGPGAGHWQCRFAPTYADCGSQFVWAPQGQTTIYISGFSPPTPGTFQVASVIDSTGQAAESNEKNNQFITTINVAP